MNLRLQGKLVIPTEAKRRDLRLKLVPRIARMEASVWNHLESRPSKQHDPCSPGLSRY
jgi:hypothetical protein